MSINKLISDHLVTMKKHKNDFDYLKAKNANRRNEINESINHKRKAFNERRNKNSEHFNLIRNKLR